MDDIEKIININTKKKQPVVGVIIQARMTSQRLPGKPMLILKGKPVLEHVIRNAKEIRPVDKVILAVPDTDESEPMLKLAKSLHILNFCGKENNVLNRYYEAAKYHGLDVIVRITGDCPFVNPKVCSEILQLLLWRKLDYCSNIEPIRSYPKGMDCEVFTMDCLEAAELMVNLPERTQEEIKLDALNIITEDAKKYRYDREHVTPWMQRTKEIKKANVIQKNDCSHINLCVDVAEDLIRLEKYTFSIGAKNDNR